MKNQRTLSVVALAITLVTLPYVFIYHTPSVEQFLCGVSTPIDANKSDAESTSGIPTPIVANNSDPESASGISTRIVVNNSDAVSAAVSLPAPVLATEQEQEMVPDPTADEASGVSDDLREVLGSNVSDARPDKALEAVLASAATADKTVILTTLNQAWATKGAIIDIFLESFHRGENTKFLLKHLVIVALDQRSFERCRELHRHCFMLKTNGVDFTRRKKYMTKDFLKMMWRRMVLLRTILELGYNFVFTDADILWFRNPFDQFARNTDFQISSDKYRGNPWTLRNLPNCGFQYVRSNARTIAMYRHWCKGGEDHPSVDEQSLLKLMIKRNELAAFKVQIRFLETDRFSGFCERSKNMTKVVTMHANCCVGMDNKVQDLRRAMQDWESSRSLPLSNTTTGVALWHAPAACRHSVWPSPPRRSNKSSPSPEGKQS